MATTSRSSNDGERIEVEMPEFLRIFPSDITIGDQIGRGGYSTVHKATWIGKHCAAKVVQTTDVLAIQKEVSILSKLSHPNIISCLGFSVDNFGEPSNCMILMELMESDLRQLMNERLKDEAENALPFSETEAVEILCQLAAGMEYLHGQGIFHGDLKASNVLVSHDCDGKLLVKITDFGVSQVVKLDPTETSEEFMRKRHFQGDVGTRGYQAPEVSSSSMPMVTLYGRSFAITAVGAAPELLLRRAEGIVRKLKIKKWKGFYTAKADAYCFAMTCYEIFSGRIPFESVSKPDIPALVLEGVRPELPRGLDRRLVALIEVCWDQKPSNRPTFSDIKHSLETWSRDHSSQELLNDDKISEETGFRDQSSQEKSTNDQSKKAAKFWGRMLRRFRRGKSEVAAAGCGSSPIKLEKSSKQGCRTFWKG